MVLASGDTWYGPQKLFGRLGDRRQTRDPLHFYRQGDHSVGHRIDLAGRFDQIPRQAPSFMAGKDSGFNAAASSRCIEQSLLRWVIYRV